MTGVPTFGVVLHSVVEVLCHSILSNDLLNLFLIFRVKGVRIEHGNARLLFSLQPRLVLLLCKQDATEPLGIRSSFCEIWVLPTDRLPYPRVT